MFYLLHACMEGTRRLPLHRRAWRASIIKGLRAWECMAKVAVLHGQGEGFPLHPWMAQKVAARISRQRRTWWTCWARLEEVGNNSNYPLHPFLSYRGAHPYFWVFELEIWKVWRGARSSRNLFKYKPCMYAALFVAFHLRSFLSSLFSLSSFYSPPLKKICNFTLTIRRTPSMQVFGYATP